MNKKLGFWSIVLLGINCIIGTGIFGLPNKAYSMVGELSIPVLLFDAILVTFIALCFSEAASRFKVNGGPYIYAKEAFGNFFGYEVGLMKWLMGVIGWATFAVFFGTRLAGVFPVLDNPMGKTFIMISVVVILTIINLLGVKSSKIVNNTITIGKLLPLFIFIFAGILFFGKLDGGSAVSTITTPTNGTLVNAVILLFFAFTGFEAIGIAAGDMEDPQKNLPKAIITVMVIVSLIYVAVLFISIKALGPGLALSKTPVADAAGILMGPIGKAFISAGVLVSILGINMAGSYTSSKSGVSLAETGLLPKLFLKQNSKGAYTYAILASAIATLILALSGSFTTLAAIGVIVRFIQYIPTALSIIVFRHRDKKAGIKHEGFKIPFGLFVPIVAAVVCIGLLIDLGMTSPHKIVWGLGGLIVVAPFYRFSKKRMEEMDLKG